MRFKFLLPALLGLGLIAAAVFAIVMKDDMNPYFEERFATALEAQAAGEDYISALRTIFAGDVPGSSDFERISEGDPLAELSVRGFGPIAKAWLPRRGFAGTFDAAWERDRHPRMPADYDLAFWNAAPGPLQFGPHLAGNEMIRLRGVSHAEAPVEVLLPGVGLVLEAEGEDSVNVPMLLDTVQLDVVAEDPADHRLALTWRALLPNPAGFFHGTLLPTETGG